MLIFIMLLEHFKNHLWSIEYPNRRLGMKIRTRMTVIRLGDGSLFLHSPIPLTKQLQGRLEILGPVRYVASPNKFHHLFMGDYPRAYPNVRLYASPGLVEKRSDLRFQDVLRNSPEPEWKDDLDQTIFSVSWLMEEVIFFHRLSRTLILTDLGFHVPAQAPLILKVIAKMSGVYEKFGPAPFLKWTMNDRAAARQSFEKILSWDLDRILIAHGPGIETNGKEVFRKAFQKILNDS